MQTTLAPHATISCDGQLERFRARPVTSILFSRSPYLSGLFFVFMSLIFLPKRRGSSWFVNLYKYAAKISILHFQN